MQSILIAPPNSVVLVMDRSIGRIPWSMGDGIVSATRSCVAIGCRSESDGLTDIQLGSIQEHAPTDKLVFEGELATPSGTLSVFSVLYDELLSAKVSQGKTHVKIFANDLTEPDRVTVLF